MGDSHKCPVCGEEGSHYVGTALGAQFHHFQRAIWDLHQLRLAADRCGEHQLSAYVSVLIRQLEDVFEQLYGETTH